jgi:hypothetical protein
MQMKIIKWILCILVVVIGLFYFILHFIMKGDKKIEVKQTNEVKNILLHQKGVKESEISLIKTEYSWKANLYTTYVIYKDEPKASYGYYYIENENAVQGQDRPIHDMKNAKLVQDCTTYDNNQNFVDGNPERKHWEKTCQ